MVSNHRSGCATLQTTHMNDANKAKQYQALLQGRAASELSLMKPKRLWDYLVQITCLLRALHYEGLAYGLVEPSKILCQEGKRCVNCL